MSRARDLALRARGLLDVLDAVDRDVAPTRAQKPVVDLDAPLRAFVDASARENDANILSLSLARREREVAALREALRRAEDERDAALSESRDAALERERARAAIAAQGGGIREGAEADGARQPRRRGGSGGGRGRRGWGRGRVVGGGAGAVDGARGGGGARAGVGGGE